MNSFQLVGLDYAEFAPLFELDDAALTRVNARRVFATESPGFPCRVRLVDAQIGEELVLVPFEHQPANSPYKAAGPIFVRRAATKAEIAPGVIPPYIATRLMSVRAYDADELMTDATVCAGRDTATIIQSMFGNPDVAYIHLHNAGRGCFSCRVKRLST